MVKSHEIHAVSLFKGYWNACGQISTSPLQVLNTSVGWVKLFESNNNKINKLLR